jgi:alkylhydroperoxidase family enzyme
MTTRPSSPRVAPLRDTEHTKETAELLETVGMPAGPAANIFTTLVRHPGLFRRWLPFAGKLLDGKLPARDRELVILRTGWLCESEYEWGQHVLLARRSGLSDDEIRRIQAGPDVPGWDPFDATLLHAADELHDDSCVTDATWRQLAGRYDERQLVELVMLIGHYHLVAFTLNSLGVKREAGVPGYDG